MQPSEIIEITLNYIELNLKTDITAEELAEKAGYSTYHYYRLFSSTMGSSIASYILKRRLDHALLEIAEGRKSIETVLEYGFNTYAGFYKAFRKIYGCSPKKYISIYGLHKPQQPEVSIVYSKSTLKKILQNWDIPYTLPIKGIYTTSNEKESTNVWSIGEEFILKTGERSELFKNLLVTKALHKEGFVSSLPIQTKSGKDFLEGNEIFVLTKVLKGSLLPKEIYYGEQRLKFTNEYGQSIAHLHKALKIIQQDIDSDEINLYQNVMNWAMPNIRQQNLQWDMGIEENFFEDYRMSFGKLYNHLPKQLIHRDPNPSNILFDGDKVSGFVDFDLSEINIRLWDPCYCATGFLSESTEEMYKIWPDLLKSILYGYNNVNPLSENEKKAIYYVICSIQI